MLSLRKRKHQDEDEPLVPHGLIAQALEARSSVESPQAIDPPAPPEVVVDTNSALDAIKKPSSSDRSAGFERTLPTVLPSKPIPATSNTGQPSAVENAARIYRDGLVLVRHQGKILQNKILQKKIRSVQVSSYMERLGSLVGKVLVAAHARARDTVHRVGLSTSKLAHISVSRGRTWQAGAKVHLARFRVASVASYRAQQFRVMGWIRATAARLFRPTNVEPTVLETVSPRPARHGIRIRLKGAPLQARIMITRLHSEWRLESEPSHNARLWTSLAMGAASALLVMSIFSATMHYGKASLPGRHSPATISNESSVIPAAAAEVTPSAPSKHLKPKTRVQNSTLPDAPSPNRSKLLRNSQLAKPKIHPKRNPDEDYVAKDTYVYYGKPASR